MADDIKKYRDSTAEDQRFISDIKEIVLTAKEKAYQAADTYQVISNWLVGRRIVEQEQQGKTRAEYGKRVIELASEALTEVFGKGYGLTQIKNFKRFYLLFKNLGIQQIPIAELEQKGQTVSAQFNLQIQQTVSAQFELAKYLPINLSWSHYERLMRIKDDDERD